MRALLTLLRSYPGPVLGIFTTTALSRAGAMVIPFLALYLAERFHFTAAQATKTMGIYGAGSILATVLGGYAVDRWGCRRLILLSYAGGVVTILALLRAHSVAWLVASVFACGVCIELVRPPSSTLLTHYMAGPQLTKAFSLHHTMINIGFLIAPLLGSALLAWGFEWLFAWNAVALAGCWAIAWRLIWNAPSTTSTEDTARDDQETFFVGRFALVMLVELLFMIPMVLGFSVLPLYIHQQLALPTWVYGVTVSWNAIGIIILAYPLTAWLSRWHPFIGTGLGTLVLGAGTALFAIARTLPGLLAAEAVVTIGEALAAAVLYQLITLQSPRHLRGRLFGISHAVSAAGAMVGPLGAGLLLDWFGFGPCWVLCGTTGVVACGLCMYGYRAWGHADATANASARKREHA
ncbi:MAG: MFS transporter [Deltaproteobacteria bacterium]|nr:MFS transporter [Deltaproteobacteria bacterium]